MIVPPRKCHRCNLEAVDAVELVGTGLAVCAEHVLAEDRRVNLYALDRVLVGLERSTVAAIERERALLERIRGKRAEIRAQRLEGAREADGGSWGDRPELPA